MDFLNLVQDFVNATSMLVNERTINIMDTQGIIIASSDKSRVGTFHKGAAEVIATGKEVLIRKENLHLYPGAKEGYNMPIFIDGNLVGVVGVFGNPDEVGNIANLLRVYVVQYFKQQAIAKHVQLEKEVRDQLLNLLIYGKGGQSDNVIQFCSFLGIKIKFPLKVFVFYRDVHTEHENGISCFVNFERFLFQYGLLNKSHDIYGAQDGSFVLLHSMTSPVKKDCDTDEMLQQLIKKQKCRLSISSPCNNFNDIHNSFDEALTLSRISSAAVCDIAEYRYKLQYLYHCMITDKGNKYADELYSRFCAGLSKCDVEPMLVTAQVYYEEGGSVTKAASRLHLHKNTLIYRMKHIYLSIGLENESDFIKEFFIRLILEKHHVLSPP